MIGFFLFHPMRALYAPYPQLSTGCAGLRARLVSAKFLWYKDTLFPYDERKAQGLVRARQRAARELIHRPARRRRRRDVMLKNELRHILNQDGTQEAEAWFECLTLRQEDDTLRVVFPIRISPPGSRAINATSLKRPSAAILLTRACRAWFTNTAGHPPRSALLRPLPAGKVQRASRRPSRTTRVTRKTISPHLSATPKTPSLWPRPRKLLKAMWARPTTPFALRAQRYG